MQCKTCVFRVKFTASARVCKGEKGLIYKAHSLHRVRHRFSPGGIEE